jgi:hypothetical protein
MANDAASRPLTPREWAELSDGLALALRRAGVHPRIVARAHPAARVAALRFGATPIMAIGRTIWWPGAAASFAGGALMAVLQHELQHLLDYAQGRLSLGGYLLLPKNWRYRYRLSPSTRWEALGAEQRASVAEDLWRSERGPDVARTSALRALAPWARAWDAERAPPPSSS